MSTSLLKKVQEAVRRMIPLTVKGQEQVLQNITLAILRELQRPAVENKKLLSECHNAALSLKEGLHSGDADTKDVKAFLQEVNKFYDAAVAEEDKKAAKKDAGPAPVEQQPMSDRRVTQNVIDHYSKFKTLLPSRVKNFKAVKMPLIPIPKGMPLSLPALKKYGFAKMAIDGYPVLENQVVVGLDIDWVNENFRKRKKDDAVGTATEYVLEMLKHRTSQPWVVLGPGVREGFVLWVWVAKSRDANLLYKASPGGHLNLRAWRFAFNP